MREFPPSRLLPCPYMLSMSLPALMGGLNCAFFLIGTPLLDAAEATTARAADARAGEGCERLPSARRTGLPPAVLGGRKPLAMPLLPLLEVALLPPALMAEGASDFLMGRGGSPSARAVEFYGGSGILRIPALPKACTQPISGIPSHLKR